MKLKDAALRKSNAAAVQSAINDTAEEYGLDADHLAKGKIKIDKNALYISFYYNDFNNLNLLYDKFILLLFSDIKTVNLEIISNKISSKSYIITDNVFTKIPVFYSHHLNNIYQFSSFVFR